MSIATPVATRTPVTRDARFDVLAEETLDSTSSIAKAARVLRALATAGPGDVGVTRIASSAALPKSTTHRVLAELTNEGLVTHHGSRYRLGPDWFELHGALTTPLWVEMVEKARAPLAQLFERTGATVHLGVLHEDEVLYLEKLTARGGTTVPTRVGSRMPATCTALGKALLAFSANTAVRKLMTKPLPVLSRGSIIMPGLLLRQLQEIRDTGVAFDLEESQLGVFCVAAPIFQSGQLAAAVSVTRVGARGLAPTDTAEARLAAKQIGCWLEDGA